MRRILTSLAVLAGITLFGMNASTAATPRWDQVSAAADHTCAIKSGQLFCWGINDQGQLGDGSHTDSPTPKRITTAGDWKHVSTGPGHTCAVRGKLYCWGTIDQEWTTPHQFTTATDWTWVDAPNTDHLCAIRGKLYCWGSNTEGQLGTGDDDSRVEPKQITTATDWKKVSVGYRHTCAIRSVGKLYCWGYNYYGQVGDGHFGEEGTRWTPKQITTATDWKDVAAGQDHTCAVRGKLYCWGYSFYGPVGDGSSGTGSGTPVPKRITTATDWTSVDVSSDHTCAIRGKLYCWGYNEYGQLGTGDTNDRYVPKQITTATGWKSVSVSENSARTCGITTKIYCWGHKATLDPPTPNPDNFRTTPGFVG